MFEVIEYSPIYDQWPYFVIRCGNLYWTGWYIDNIKRQDAWTTEIADACHLGSKMTADSYLSLIIKETFPSIGVLFSEEIE